MRKYHKVKKLMVFTIVLSFYFLSMKSVIGTEIQEQIFDDEILLPPPKTIDMNLEETIFRRMSMREFTDDPISDEDLSTILYAAYGLRNDGEFTVAGIDNVNAAIIYVIREDAAYKYNPANHSLEFYKIGDFRNLVGWQYTSADILLGLCWDTNLCDANFAGAELGEIGQNIAFAANSLDIGTVVTGEAPPAIDRMGIPDNEHGMIIMYMGYPVNNFNFLYLPFWLSFLPKIQKSGMSLSEAIETRTKSTIFGGDISRKELSHILWACYGFSYNIDRSNQEFVQIKRHRTVPSGHGYYPLHIFAVTKIGIFKYYPNVLINIYEVPVDFFGLPIISFTLMKKFGDFRENIAEASSMPSIGSAPLSIVIVLDLEMAKELAASQFHRFWYYEAGAAVHNVMLEATALGLKNNIAYPTDPDSISNQLKLNDEQIPILIVPIGK